MIDSLIIVMAYLLGGISTGYYLVKLLLRQDVRKYGSGGIGATNVGRILGPKGFLLTFLGDFSKGCLVTTLAILLELPEITVILGLIAVVVGHIWPLQLGFRGGKGVATAFGGIVAIDPQFALVLFLMAIGVFSVTRKFVLSGLIVILGSPMTSYLMSRSSNQVLGMLSVTILLLIAHRENISIIMNEATKRRE